jgi:uroporphyrin-3 C-methyltransferase
MTSDKSEQPEPDTDRAEASEPLTEEQATDAMPAEADVAESTVDSEHSDSRPRRRRRGPALLVLAIAVVAIGAAAYVWWQLRSLTGVPDAVALSQTDLARLDARMDQLAAEESTLLRDLDELTDRLRQQQRELEELTVRSNRIERSVEDLPGVADEARTAWLVAEAEYFLRIANSQLILASNVEVATRALRLADEKLRDLADPRLMPVRELISDETAALKALPQPDRAGVALALQSVARTLDLLPLRQARPEQFTAATDDSSRGEDGFERALDSAMDALGSIVEVRRTEVEVGPQLTAADRAMLIRSVDLELLVAKLAFLRGEGELYRQSLEQVAERLNRSFDVQSAAVMAALDTLTELQAVEMAETTPDVSGSLALLIDLTGVGGTQ